MEKVVFESKLAIANYDKENKHLGHPSFFRNFHQIKERYFFEDT